ncbi:MAG: Lsr2 family protein [Acidimicrobiia bacterium]|nr:Lsr2 family protein [Acidimicrobiia bacterium]
MAQKVQVLLTCDLDEEEVEAAETVTFGFDGSSYAIELCNAHLDEFNEWMQGYIGAARRADGPRRRARSGGSATRGRTGSGGDVTEVGTIREWARSNGFKVSDRGRIAADVREAFEASQK